jgi:hypothetical protein
MRFLIDDEHLAHASMPGVYNVYLYTPKKWVSHLKIEPIEDMFKMGLNLE